ncbi:hypothetical protein ENTCAN_07826 [Enterobacter cancerogenus ATCC 35316]|nr:hypothetical protein ENTCAN_07826 [Enterobacter cancerogenus ATCC 35316]
MTNNILNSNKFSEAIYVSCRCALQKSREGHDLLRGSLKSVSVKETAFVVNLRKARST